MSQSTRRQFLGTATAACLAGFLPRRAFAESEGLTRISILHTTDLHGHILPTTTYEGEANVGGLARCATQIRAWRSENPQNVLIDVGDVYQGTEVGLRTQGQIMTQCFDALGYDGWVVGNHEFDWGVEPFARVLENSSIPVLSANAVLEGKPAGKLSGGKSPFEKIKPYVLKNVGGFQIAVIGLTTPGLPYWFQPEFTKGFEAADPIRAAVETAQEVRALGADAVIFATHMGVRQGGDDFANRVDAISRAVPDAALIIAGHTHRDLPSQNVNGVLYSQANYYGINVGKTDLFFDASTRKLVRAEAMTRRMTSEIPLDPGILSLAHNDLEESEKILSSSAGLLTEMFSTQAAPGQPSDVERLIGTAVTQALQQKGVMTDAVIHGLFSQQNLEPGLKTIADVWKILPYENYVITGEMTPEQLMAALSEMPITGQRRGPSLIGLRFKMSPDAVPQIVGVESSDGQPLDRTRRYLVAMNTYDASGAGQRMMKLRAIMSEPSTKAQIHRVQTREALISFLSGKGSAGVGRRDVMS